MAEECKICRVLAKPGDLCRVLNQGLYHKYTSSQDYFYTRDINALLAKKRKPFCIRYYDEVVYDECKERLKGYFRKKDTIALMHEIKQFYTKFQNFPRNFHGQFFNIINSNIRKHRRLEYVKVFNGVDLDDDKAGGGDGSEEQSGVMKKPKDEGEFNFMELLGDTFLQDNYKDVSDVIVGGVRLERRRDTESSLKEVEMNFKALYKLPPNTISDAQSVPFSNALYNKNYMLYSRSDSETAEDMLKQIIHEFREVDFSRKASVTLAEQVLQQVRGSPTNKKYDTRQSPTFKYRTPGGSEMSPSYQTSKKSLGSNNFTAATATNIQLQKHPIQPLTSTQRVPNLRSNTQVELESVSLSAKLSQSKFSEQGKPNPKFSVENLNDIVINRNKILSKLYQFRSTRSKSGGLKSMAPTSKTPTSQTRRPLGLHVDTQGLDSTDPKQIQTAYYINYQSQSPSPERTREDPEKATTIEMISQSKNNIDSPYYNSIKRSISNGRNGDLRDMGSPTNQNNNKSIHKKSSSVVKRGGVPPKKHLVSPSIQNFASNNSGIAINMSNNNNLDTPGSPGVKLINPLRTTLGGTQTYYMRHQSPLEERMGLGADGGLHKINSEKIMKNLNIRALKNTSPNRMDTYKAAAMSLSGRHQNLSEISQGIQSLVSSQASLQMVKQNSQPMRRKNVGGEIPFSSKVNIRGSGSTNQMMSPTDDTMEKDRKGKRILELNDGAINSFKDLRFQSKDQTPSNLGSNIAPSSTTSLNKFKVEVKKSVLGSYTVKASAKDVRFTLKK